MVHIIKFSESIIKQGAKKVLKRPFFIARSEVHGKELQIKYSSRNKFSQEGFSVLTVGKDLLPSLPSSSTL
jgi:hypothetical protein